MLNYNSPTEIRRVLEQLGVRLQKRWGQNFLVNRGAREAIVSLVAPEAADYVWEIGPGLGTLTVLLLPEVRALAAFEIDRGLVTYLRQNLGDRNNFTLVTGDVVKTWRSFLREHGTPDKIVGNLPYSSASALIAALAENRVLPKKSVFTVQRELAERMRAQPGNKNYSSFAVLCQTVYRISEHMQLKPGSFFPAPEVHSSVVVLESNREVEGVPDWTFFLTCLRMLFQSRRKTMRNNLLAGGITSRDRAARLDGIFQKLGIDPGLRSERLSPEVLMELSQHLAAELQDL
jgi:16S rRNA (adenine1518-N6/adenine1519-N6)-dimethyltransferase